MDTNKLFMKVTSGEELTDEEKLEVIKASINKKDGEAKFQKITSGCEISMEDRIELARGLVAKNVEKILQKEMVVASLSGEETEITLKARECTDSDNNIRKYLTILGAKDIKVTSDFPCGRAGENYEGTTTIKFKY